MASLRQGLPTAEGAELLVAAPEPLGRGERGGLPQALPQRRVEQPRRLVVVVLSAARRLRDDEVNDARFVEFRRGQAQELGGARRLRAVLEENRGAALGRDDGVDGVSPRPTRPFGNCQRAGSPTEIKATSVLLPRRL